MAFIRNLSEKLEAQQIYDSLKGKYETRFKIEGAEYALLATSVAGEYDDNTSWMLEFENIKSHRIGTLDNDPKVAKAFAEAVDQWVKEKNPHCFYTYGSHIESIQKILESVKKKVKKYNLIDPTLDTKTDEGIEVAGNPVGKIVWTKMVEQESVSTEDREAIESDKFEQPFEEPKDIKPNKSHMSGTKQTDKLDKGDGAYEQKSESFAEFKTRMLSESKEEVVEEKIEDLWTKDQMDFFKFKMDKMNEDDEMSSEMSPENNKQNVLNLLRVASNDMIEIVKTSERPIEDQKKIFETLKGVYETLQQRKPEDFEKLQGYTGDKVPEQDIKKVFGVLQSVIRSQEDSLADKTVEELVSAIVEGVDEVLAGSFRPSVATLGVKKREALGQEFLSQRMKEMGMD